MKESKRGGKRIKAGRKLLNGKQLMKSIKLNPEQWEKAKRIGDGNSAFGIRKAIESYESSKDME